MIIPLSVSGYRAWLLRLRTDAHSDSPYAPWFKCAAGVQTALNALVVNSADRWVLIDTGATDTASLLCELLEDVGCGEAGITDIALTGTGADKAGGLRSSHGNRFTHARIVTADDGPTMVAPGLQLEPAPGPTEAHATIFVESRTTPLLHIGDLVLHPVQMNTPEMPMSSEADSLRAAQSRLATLKRLADHGTLTVGSRLPGPGFVGRTPHGFGWSAVLFG